MLRTDIPEETKDTTKEEYFPQLSTPAHFYRASTSTATTSNNNGASGSDGDDGRSLSSAPPSLNSPTRLARSTSLGQRVHSNLSLIASREHTATTNSINSVAPSASPSPEDTDGDPECENELNQHPNIDMYLRRKHPHVQELLQPLKDTYEGDYSPHPDFIRIHAQKVLLKEHFAKSVNRLPVEDLKFLSLYMNSVQVGNSIDVYFKIIRRECGGFGYFQTYGNTKTWQAMRSLVKASLDNRLSKPENPAMKWPLAEAIYRTYLQIFQQHSGRFPWGQTKSEKKFLTSYSPLNPEEQRRFAITVK